MLKTFKTAENFYIYSAWNNQIAEIPEDMFNYFSTNTLPKEALEEAVELGLLPQKTKPMQVLPPPIIDKGIEQLSKTGPKTLMLGVTEDCNFRCRYCIFSGSYQHSRTHSKKKMPLETGFSAINWVKTFKPKQLHIGFYGGEPLLCYENIRMYAEYAKSELTDTSLSFGISTNASLLTPEVTEFFANNNFEIFISLDGPAHLHDRFRKDRKGADTFQVIMDNIHLLKKKHPAYYRHHVNYNVTIPRPEELRELKAFFDSNTELFEGHILKFAFLNNESSEINKLLPSPAKANRTELDWLRNDFTDDCIAGRTPSAMGRDFFEAKIKRIHERGMGELEPFATTGGQCIPGERCFVDTAGDFHMCESRSTDYVIGNVNSGYNLSSIRKTLTEMHNLLSNHCSSCWACRLCRKCVACLSEGGRLSEDRLNSLCKTQKKTIKNDLTSYCTILEQNQNGLNWPHHNPTNNANRRMQ